MGKYQPKTRENDADVDAFIDSVEDEQQRADAHQLKQLFEKVTRRPAKMWGGAIIGFGSFTHHNTLGANDWPEVGFSPRKGNLVLYITDGFEPYQDLLQKLGKHRTGKSCLYVKRLSDIDLKVLKEMITLSLKETRRKKGS